LEWLRPKPALRREPRAHTTGKREAAVAPIHTYMADCDLPGITREQLAGSEARIQRACEQAVARGDVVRYLCAIWVPGDWRVMYLFQARGPAPVEAV